MFRTITQVPDIALRTYQEDVSKRKGKKLVKELVDSSFWGIVGLAANQIGLEGRVLLYTDKDHIWHPMVNPIICGRTDEHTIQFEGCGSIPDIRVPVKRPQGIWVKHSFEEDPEYFEDWTARIICHEVDHLDGILITDYGEAFLPRGVEQSGSSQGS